MHRALTAEEVEVIMGFDKGHTALNGVSEISPRDRRKYLGNSFQVDNICYLLHPLKVCWRVPQ